MVRNGNYLEPSRLYDENDMLVSVQCYNTCGTDAVITSQLIGYSDSEGYKAFVDKFSSASVMARLIRGIAAQSQMTSALYSMRSGILVESFRKQVKASTTVKNFYTLDAYMAVEDVVYKVVDFGYHEINSECSNGNQCPKEK